MPFTISHVAAVLPLTHALSRRRLLSAAIIGSMAPDFGFFLPWRPARFETHGMLALLTFCLPMGLAAFWLFQRVMKRPLVELLPDAAYRRYRPWAEPADIASVAQWLLAACGILAGALTHLVWDAFTHEGARGVRMFPAIDDPVVDIAGHHLVGSRLLQDASSVVGLAVTLAVAAYALWPRGRRGAAGSEAAPPGPLSAAERRGWLVLELAAALAASVALYRWRSAAGVFAHSLGGQLGIAAVAALRGTAVSLLLCSACLSLRLRRAAPMAALERAQPPTAGSR